MVYLLSHSQIHYDNIASLETNKSAYQTTKPASKGRWYFEYTHLSGDRYYIAGFHIHGRVISVYPQGSGTGLKIYFANGIEVEGYEPYQSIGLSNFVYNQTVGLAYDTYSEVFSVYCDQQEMHFQTRCNTNNIVTVSPYFDEAIDRVRSFKDTLSVDFGGMMFKYQVPKYYLPWGFIFHSKSTKIPSKIFSRFLLL